jgi:hypothetical protein
MTYIAINYKVLTFPVIDLLFKTAIDKSLKAKWKNSLSYQLHAALFVDYEIVKMDLKILFEKILT